MHVLAFSWNLSWQILSCRLRPVGFPLRQAKGKTIYAFHPGLLDFCRVRCPLSQARSGDVEDWRGGGGEASECWAAPTGSVAAVVLGATLWQNCLWSADPDCFASSRKLQPAEHARQVRRFAMNIRLTSVLALPISLSESRLSYEDRGVHLHRLAGQLLRRAEDQPQGCCVTVAGLLVKELWPVLCCEGRWYPAQVQLGRH